MDCLEVQEEPPRFYLFRNARESNARADPSLRLSVQPFGRKLSAARTIKPDHARLALRGTWPDCWGNSFQHNTSGKRTKGAEL
jgi:hypothetical protein